MHGWNNNPSAKQFKESYRKILHLANVSVPLSANCIPKDDTVLLKYESTNDIQDVEEDVVQQNVEINVEEFVNFIFIEHNYFIANNKRVNEYFDEIIAYISGYIVKIIVKKINCLDCKQLLLPNTQNQSDRNNKLIQRKNNKNKLFEASNNVVTICKIAHKLLRSNQHKLFTTKNILQYLICQAQHLIPSHIFDDNHIFNQSPLFDHQNQIIKLILKHFFSLTLKHESKLFVDSIERIRMKNNKIVLFKNQ